jgi:3',5'-cyclic AMP phosphodiesterase CpdA
MRIIAHISDLHFGRLDHATLPPLRAAITEANPHVVVVSGDLTQRAHAAQFKEARAFLDTLPTPQIIVPGNHDVPLYNVVSRLLSPLRNYRQFITQNLEPFYSDAELAVLGLNTARSLTIKDGRINKEQVAKACSAFSTVQTNAMRVIVTHHPFDAPKKEHEDDIVWRAKMAMKAFAASGVDMILTGHLHSGHARASRTRYQLPGPLMIAAGTATSTRTRDESNSWNLIRAGKTEVFIDRMHWNGATFAVSRTEHFIRGAGGWQNA